tara:strand:+ start:85 stop:1068 length:984 start_codon:yes stop_codon:yes gene_type:complete
VNYFKITLKILIPIIIIYLLIKYNSLDFSRVFELNILLILQLFFLCFFIVILGALKWFLLLRIQNTELSLKRTVESYYLGYALNYYLFGVAGDVVKTIYIAKNKSNKTGIALSVILDRVVGLMCMGIIILYSVPVILENLNINSFLSIYDSNIYLYYGLLTFLIFSLFLLGKMILNSKRIENLIIRSLKKYKNKIIKMLVETIDIFFTYKKNSLNIFFNIILSISIQIIIAIALYLITLKTLMVDLSLISHTVSSVCVQILSIIPISPGNIGVGEAAFSQIMYYMNSKTLLEFASVYFIYRLINMIFALPGMFVYFFAIKRDLADEK